GAREVAQQGGHGQAQEAADGDADQGDDERTHPAVGPRQGQSPQLVLEPHAPRLPPQVDGSANAATAPSSAITPGTPSGSGGSVEDGRERPTFGIRQRGD